MKTSHLILIVTFFLGFFETNAQTEISTSSFQIDTIQYVKKSGNFYLAGKKLQPHDLKPMLLKFNSSALELKKYQQRIIPGTIIILTGLAAGVLAISQGSKYNFINPYSITLFSCNLIGIPLMISGKKHLRKSVSLYNLEILKQLN